MRYCTVGVYGLGFGFLLQFFTLYRVLPEPVAELSRHPLACRTAVGMFAAVFHLRRPHIDSHSSGTWTARFSVQREIRI